MKHVYLRFNLSCGHAARHLSKSGSAAGVGLALLRAGGGGRLKGPPQGFLQLLDKGQAQASAGFKVPSLSGCSDPEHYASYFSQTET